MTNKQTIRQGYSQARDYSTNQSGNTAAKDKSNNTKKIILTFDEEDSKYDGDPIIEPKVPYFYKYKYRKPDANLPRASRIQQRIQYTTEDTILYLKDIVYMRQDPVAFKTAAFIKRNYLRMLNKLDTIIYFLKHAAHETKKMMQGMAKLFREVGQIFQLYKHKNVDQQYGALTFKEKSKIRRVQRDFIKFVPFSVFLLIPGGEILLPPYIMIFPDAIPSQFLSEEKKLVKFIELKEAKEKAATKLLKFLPRHLQLIEEESAIKDKDAQEAFGKIRSILENSQTLPTDLLEYKNLFNRYLKFKYFTHQELMLSAEFMSLKPVTGLNTINNLTQLAGKKIPVDLPGLGIITKLILVRNLQMYFTQIRNEDIALSWEDLNSFPEEQLDKICFRRGININESTSEKLKDLRLWLSISNLRNVPDSLLLFTRIHDYASDMFEVDNNETQEEILRRSKSDTYYIEKVRAFEKAFGITELEELVVNLNQNLNEEYNPAEGKFMFQSSDLMELAAQIDEFKTRHKTITDTIKESYKVGNALLDYLEKQIILDYHFRGQQDEFEEEFEQLIDTARKFLGYELYYDLSSMTGQPLDPQSEQFQILIKKQEKTQSNIQQILTQHEIQIDSDKKEGVQEVSKASEKVKDQANKDKKQAEKQSTTS